PITASIGNSVNIFDSNLQIPYARSWTAGWQRKITRNSVIEARYVGSRHVDDWVQNNINEINIVENGFLNEFRKAQANLQANSAARRANAIAAGLPSNFLVANPDVLGSANNLGANFYTNGGGTRYQSAQFEYRQRLHGGAQIGVNYVFGRAYQNNRYGFRQDD